jgi:hypothetical protein
MHAIETEVSIKLKLSRSGSLECLDVSETMAEKLVSFTRRTAQFLVNRHRGKFDTALVRHLYDVYHLSRDGAADLAVVAGLTPAIIATDAEEFANQHPEYAEDPARETKRALAALTDDKRFEEWYEQFVDAMIYGDERPRFADVVRTFRDAVHRTMRIPA